MDKKWDECNKKNYENKKEIVYQEESSEEDCGCEKENSELNGDDLPLICYLLVPILLFGLFLYVTANIPTVFQIAIGIGEIFNCFA